MPDPDTGSGGGDTVQRIASFGNQRYWIRLETLIVLRWLAIAGQTVALLVASRYFQTQIDLIACFSVVAAAVAVNLVLIFSFSDVSRLSEKQTAAALAFDIVQLATLLYLTGGLNNPFAVLILAPATIAAATLPMRVSLLVASMTIAAVSVVARFHVPIRLQTGEILAVPTLFGFGFWLALVIGIIFLGLYSQRVSAEMKSMSEALLATQMALAREQKLTDLGGVVAAAAHELGTPLATITLVSTELVEMLSHQPELAEDAALIRSQADRCRDILRSMGRAGKDDLLVRCAPVSELIREAAEPHQGRGKTIHVTLSGASDNGQVQPTVLRRPELVHGLRNLIQNAVDFTVDTVWIDCDWTDGTLTINVSDNGPGYPPHLIGRIGDPFLRMRRDEDVIDRPGYDGMGLGLFIAKTLLERTGANIKFRNGADPFLMEDERPARRGAIASATWRRSDIEHAGTGAIGNNQLFQR